MKALPKDSECDYQKCIDFYEILEDLFSNDTIKSLAEFVKGTS